MTRFRLVEGGSRQAEMVRLGWRLARRPPKAGQLHQEMVSLMRTSNVMSVGLAGKAVLRSDGSILEDVEEVGYVLMVEPVERRRTQAVVELREMFPEQDVRTVEQVLESNSGCLERTVDHLLTLSSHLSSLSLAPSTRPLPPCPECPVCYEPFIPPKRIFQFDPLCCQCGHGHVLCEDCVGRPQCRLCPSCQGVIVGRNTALEQFLREIY